MRSPVIKSFVTAAALAVSGFGLALLAVPGQSQAEETAAASDVRLPLDIKAFARNLANVDRAGRGESATLEIKITRWTSGEDHAAVLKLIQDSPSGALPNALESQYPVGSIRDIEYQFAAEQLRYAWVTRTDDGGHHVVLASDRPMRFVEMWTGKRSRNHTITLVELDFDADGRGTGQLMLGTELTWDEEKEQVAIKKLASKPIKLTDVAQR